MTKNARSIGAPDASDPPASGVWTLAGGRLIIADSGGPATILIPTEQVRLLAVDLPLPNRAKRLAALPFAIEDQIAEPLDSVHIALGAAIGDKRYLVGVVRRDVMERWVDLAADAGLSHAAMVPDALALPRPAAGEWSVELGGDRALVRVGDGSGFAVPSSMLLAAWVAAGRPVVASYGAPLPAEMAAEAGTLTAGALAGRLLDPALDLRQGVFSRRRAAIGANPAWRRLGWIVALGAAAHIGIAAADALVLGSIAERRAEEARALATAAAPGVTLGDDFAVQVADMLPKGGPSAAPDRFVPLVSRISAALAPMTGTINLRAMGFQGNVLTMDLDSTDASLPGRIDAALQSAGIGAQTVRSPDGSIRITARAQ